MKLQRQGPNECFLATVAMLAELPLDKVREIAVEVLGESKERFSWDKSLTKIPWSEVKALGNQICQKVGISELMLLYQPGIVNTSNIQDEPDLRGKGQVSLYFGWGRAHSVAYEDGLIYDSNLTESDGPLMWNEYLQYRKQNGLCPTLEYIVVPLKEAK